MSVEICTNNNTKHFTKGQHASSVLYHFCITFVALCIWHPVICLSLIKHFPFSHKKELISQASLVKREYFGVRITRGIMHSVLWQCRLGDRKGKWLVKNWVVRCWHGYLSGARCRFAYRPADATVTYYLLLQFFPGLTFLVPAHPSSPGDNPRGS